MTLPVLVAFLLPIVVFAILLAGIVWWLEGRVAGSYQAPLALILSLSITTGLLLAVRVLTRRHARK